MRVRMQQWLLVVASVTLGVVLAAVLVRYRTYRLAVTNRWSRWTSNVRPHADIYKHWLEGKGIHFNTKEERPQPPSDSVSKNANFINDALVWQLRADLILVVLPDGTEYTPPPYPKYFSVVVECSLKKNTHKNTGFEREKIIGLAGGGGFFRNVTSFAAFV